MSTTYSNKLSLWWMWALAPVWHREWLSAVIECSSFSKVSLAAAPSCWSLGQWPLECWSQGADTAKVWFTESTMFFWASQPCPMGYPWAVAPPWTCKEPEELPGHVKSYSSGSSGPLPPCFTGVVGNADWATSPRCRVPPPGILSPFSITQLCEQQLSELSAFVCR